MPTTNGNSTKAKGVRFAEGTVADDNSDDDDVKIGAAGRPKKRKRIQNDDEQDDIDDWQPEDDDQEVPSEHDLLQAKRERRAKQRELEEDDDDDDIESSTKIDNRTSLAGEGIEIEPFHMNDERNDGTGYFDGDTYVFRKRSADEEPDAWLESLQGENEEDIHQKMAVLRSEQQRADAAEEEQESLDEWTEEDLYSKLLPNLAASTNETVMQAVQRYGALMKKKENDDNARQMAKDSFDDVTEAANALLLKGKIDIYQSKQSEIAAALSKLQEDKKPRKNAGPAAPADPTTTADDVQWEYRGSQDHQIHGPYSSQDMLNWISAGYFVGPSAVQIRSLQPKPKSTRDDLLSDLMDDEDDDKNEEGVERGEWQMSDQVDLAQYVKK